MVAKSKNILGLGLYSLREAAFYARIPPQTLGRWLFGNKSGEAVLRAQLDSDEKLVTFLDFVQAMAIRAVRIDSRVPLAKIRQAVNLARNTYHVQHPFAYRHQTYLVGGEIVIKLRDDEYVEVSGKHARNRVIPKVVETYMKDIAYDATGLAKTYTAFERNDLTVNMDPRVRFGEPLLPSCGYTAQALWEAARVEGGIEPAARAYGVTTEEIELACRYFDHLTPARAA